jgi:hypothetical protein
MWNAVIANIIVYIELNDRGSYSSPLEQQYSLPSGTTTVGNIYGILPSV